jgi:hypothetical protein
MIIIIVFITRENEIGVEGSRGFLAEIKKLLTLEALFL